MTGDEAQDAACSFAGRTAVITGGSRGIGLAAAEVLIAAGANVTVTARELESARRAADELNASPTPHRGHAFGFAAHVNDEVAARACFDRTLKEFGRVDVLVNNAGTNPAYGLLTEQDHARFHKTFDVNVWGPLMWTTLAVEAWMGEHGGAVVHTASIGGITVEPRLGVYNVSKAALMHLARQQAAELGPRVRVNAVAPGLVKTRLAEALWVGRENVVGAALPLQRIGEPLDVARAIAFLASEAASWITGQTLIVDGGTLVSA